MPVWPKRGVEILARGVDRLELVVGVDGGGSDTGEVLRCGEHAGLLEPLRELVGERGDRVGVASERAALAGDEALRRRRDVDHGSEVHVHPGGGERPPCLLTFLERLARVAGRRHLRRREVGRRTREAADRATLLVHRDQQRRVAARAGRGLQLIGEGPRLRYGLDVGREEDDSPDRAVLDALKQALRRRRSREPDHDALTDEPVERDRVA